MSKRSPGKKPARRGQSLLELVAAGTVIALTLTPALRLMRDTISVSRDLEHSDALATLAASKLEQSLAVTAATWDVGTTTGTFTTDGYANLLWSVVKSDDAGAGGIPNQLMAISVTAWDDKNGNAAADTGEPRCSFASKIAKLSSYNYEAQGK